MYRVEGDGIVIGLSRGARLVLGCFSAVCGLVMVAVAPPKSPAFYLIAVTCLLLCIACIGNTRIRQFLGSCIGAVLFAASMWYGYTRFGQAAFFNALVLFVTFGLPGLAYVVSARFGFLRRRVEVLSGADKPRRLRQRRKLRRQVLKQRRRAPRSRPPMRKRICRARKR